MIEQFTLGSQPDDIILLKVIQFIWYVFDVDFTSKRIEIPYVLGIFFRLFIIVLIKS